MDLSPGVAVLLATHNGARYLEAQVESILDQTHRNLALVCLDDGSSDGTVAILKDFAGRDARVTVRHNETNTGVVRTFEKLLTMVDQPNFCFADQDDVWRLDKIEIGLKTLTESGAAMVYSDLEVVDQDLGRICQSMWRHSGVHPVSGDNIVALLLRNPVSGCVLLGKSAILDYVLPFPKDIPSHDWWVAACGCLHGGIAFIPTATIKYRQHAYNDRGGLASGFKGLPARLEKWDVRFREYPAYRFGRRLKMVKALLGTCDDARVRLLHSFLSVPWPVRAIFSPAYLTFLILFGRHLGARGILVEWGLNILPR